MNSLPDTPHPRTVAARTAAVGRWFLCLLLPGWGQSARSGATSSFIAMLALACGGAASDPGPNDTGTSPPPADTPALTRTVVLQGLSSPWDIAIATDGAMFFTERCRGL